MRDIIIFFILLILFFGTVYTLSPYVNLTRENFKSGTLLKDVYFNNEKLTPEFLSSFDSKLNLNNGIDDYANKYLLLFKRCYLFPKIYADNLLATTPNVFNFQDVLTSLSDDQASNLCIHKYVKYTSMVSDVISSITDDINNFHDCKLLLNNKNNTSIIGNVYLLIGQVPYMVDNKSNTISTRFDSESLGYTSYLDQQTNPDSPITSGQIIYIYYLIYDCYDAKYNQSPVNGNVPNGKFENYILPALDAFASNDQACMSKCSQLDTNGYLCGCLSTAPSTVYNKKNRKLDLSINAVGADYFSLIGNNMQDTSPTDPPTCKKLLQQNSLNVDDVSKLNGGYAARCVNNSSTNPKIGNYMILYKINQDTFKKSGSQIFASQG